MGVRRKRRSGVWLMVIGVLLLAGALGLTVYNLWDEARAERVTASVLSQLQAQTTPAHTQTDSAEAAASSSSTAEPLSPAPMIPTESIDPSAIMDGDPAAPPSLPAELPAYILDPEMEMPTVKIDGNLYIGTLEIPALGLSLPIMSSWSYQALKIAPCRYAGSAYLGNLVIAAHNYNAHFGNLDQLVPGDSILFTDAAGNQFFYQVGEIQKLSPTALENALTDGWDLTLFTCTVGGQARLTVRCSAAGVQ